MTTIDYKGYQIEIMQDEHANDPRHEFGGFGHMLCFHRNYTIGDKPKGFDTLAELRDWLIDNEETVIYLPIYIYEHSGITISTSPFSCLWDSGQIGYIYIPYEEIKLEFKGWKLITKKRIEKIREMLQSEVKLYDQYLQGHVYGYNVTDPNGNDVDSCWGFYGDWEEDSYMLDQAKEVIDSAIEDEKETERQINNIMAL